MINKKQKTLSSIVRVSVVSRYKNRSPQDLSVFCIIAVSGSYNMRKRYARPLEYLVVHDQTHAHYSGTHYTSNTIIAMYDLLNRKISSARTARLLLLVARHRQRFSGHLLETISVYVRQFGRIKKSTRRRCLQSTLCFFSLRAKYGRPTSPSRLSYRAVPYKLGTRPLQPGYLCAAHGCYYFQ